MTATPFAYCRKRRLYYAPVSGERAGPLKNNIIYFGRCWDKCHKQNYISDNLVRTYFPQCRHSYGVTRKGAEIIIKKSIPLIDKGGDQNIAILIENGELEAYAVTPNLFFQNRDVLGSNLNNLESSILSLASIKNSGLAPRHPKIDWKSSPTMVRFLQQSVKQPQVSHNLVYWPIRLWQVNSCALDRRGAV